MINFNNPKLGTAATVSAEGTAFLIRQQGIGIGIMQQWREALQNSIEAINLYTIEKPNYKGIVEITYNQHMYYERGWIKATIIDNGTGIPEHLIENIAKKHVMETSKKQGLDGNFGWGVSFAGLNNNEQGFEVITMTQEMYRQGYALSFRRLMSEHSVNLVLDDDGNEFTKIPLKVNGKPNPRIPELMHKNKQGHQVTFLGDSEEHNNLIPTVEHTHVIGNEVETFWLTHLLNGRFNSIPANITVRAITPNLKDITQSSSNVIQGQQSIVNKAFANHAFVDSKLGRFDAYWGLTDTDQRTFSALVYSDGGKTRGGFGYIYRNENYGQRFYQAKNENLNKSLSHFMRGMGISHDYHGIFITLTPPEDMILPDLTRADLKMLNPLTNQYVNISEEERNIQKEFARIMPEELKAYIQELRDAENANVSSEDQIQDLIKELCASFDFNIRLTDNNEGTSSDGNKQNKSLDQEKAANKPKKAKKSSSKPATKGLRSVSQKGKNGFPTVTPIWKDDLDKDVAAELMGETFYINSNHVCITDTISKAISEKLRGEYIDDATVYALVEDNFKNFYAQIYAAKVISILYYHQSIMDESSFTLFDTPYFSTSQVINASMLFMDKLNKFIKKNDTIKDYCY